MDSFESPLDPVQMDLEGLSPTSPMSTLQATENSVNANLHFMGAVESSIYSTFGMFRQ
jgi:hypothetical protein